MNKAQSLIGQTFGMRTVIDAIKDDNGKWYCICLCSCGNRALVRSRALKNGGSLGCLKCVTSKRSITHGLCGSREYSSYKAMMERCYSPNHHAFKSYGGATPPVTVCDNWKASISNFFNDMGMRPLGTSLGRINNSVIYSKETCEWQTSEEQAQDRKNTLFCTYNGNRVPLSKICKQLNIPYRKMYKLVFERNIPLEAAIDSLQ